MINIVYKLSFVSMNNQIEEINKLIEKIKNGEATTEEALALIATLDVSLDVLKILLEEIKIEQTRKNIR